MSEVQIAGSVFVSQHTQVFREEHVGVICESCLPQCAQVMLCVCEFVLVCAYAVGHCVFVSAQEKAVYVLSLNTCLCVQMEDNC